MWSKLTLLKAPSCSTATTAVSSKAYKGQVSHLQEVLKEVLGPGLGFLPRFVKFPKLSYPAPYQLVLFLQGFWEAHSAPLCHPAS